MLESVLYLRSNFMKKNEVKFYHPEINTDDLDLLIANIKVRCHSKNVFKLV